MHDRPIRTLSAAGIAGWAFPVTFVLIFILVEFLPGITHGTASITLVDLGVLTVAVVALLRVRREGLAALRASLWLWIAALTLLVYVGLASLYPTLNDPDYTWRTHMVTALRFAEFFVLAPAAAVLLRDQMSIRRFYGVVAALSVVAAAVALAQFCGLHILHSWPAGQRQPSFAGIQNLGTLGAATLALGFVGELWPESLSPWTTRAALVGGTLCTILSGGAEAGLAAGAALVAALVLVRMRQRFSLRRAAIVTAVTAVCAIGLVTIRTGDIDQFARSLGILPANHATTHQVQTYAQRTLMLYIGLRIWEAHPLFGAGWQSVREYHVYAPFLSDAHRRFPNQAPQAFPSPTNRWGIDNAYVESLAELGLVGTAVLLAFVGTTLVLGVRGVRRAEPREAQLALAGTLWMIVTLGIWAGQGFNPGSGFAALPFLALGLVAAARAGPNDPAEAPAS